MSLFSRLTLTCGLTAFLRVAALHAGQAPVESPLNVLELFTSQGCSSCLPADKLLGSLARHPDLVVLSLPIDYWDYNGWKDTLASPVFTARQKAYAEVRGDGLIYTPQTIIDGLVPVVGSDSEEINKTLARLNERKDLARVPIHMTETSNSLQVTIAAGGGAPAMIYLLRVKPESTVQIRRGENAGRNITYTNVVTAISKFGNWTGAEVSFEIPKSERPKPENERDGYVVLLQRGEPEHPGEILGAAKTQGL